MVKASDTGGVKPMSIAGRLVSERERLLGMTEAERAFRKQWLKDQELAANEPRKIPQMYEATHNPIRRAYRWPLNQLGKVLEPILGAQKAASFRYYTGKILMGVTGLYLMTYYLKYNTNDWTKKHGLRIMETRSSVFPGDPGYPDVSQRSKGSDYADKGFSKNTLKL